MSEYTIGGGYDMYSSESSVKERKIINVTGKRQVTIPLKFYEKLRFGKEVECFLTDDAIVLRPLSNSDDGFTMEILKDLVSQGYKGDELITKFEEERANIKKAISLLIDEADEIAAGKRKSATTKDIFGEE
ncbi:MAG: AbrB/MazE/SpoVT family DNA-binding domain-containing protein [Synergistaceae bacterium]|nr:AbrB/MazE/SpoVT family DNA-binding domain-containing protein [Synergistaceae bacterium]